MRKRAVLTLMLVFSLLVTSSCGLIVKDPEVDKQTVIIEVAGKTFTKEQVSQQVQYTLEYQGQLYAMYGLSFDASDPSVIASAQEQTIQGLVSQAVLEQKEAEMGLDTFTSEELAQLQTTVDETYQQYADSVKTSYFAETDLTGEELDKAVAEKMAELGYSDKETMLEDEKKTEAYNKLRAEVVKDVQVTQEEIQAQYEQKVASAKTEYESSLTAYGSAVRAGTPVYYRPDGYRHVKNILRKLNQEDSTAISDLQSQLTGKQTQLADTQASLAAIPEGDAQEEQGKAREELTAQEARLTEEVAQLQTQLDTSKEAAYAKVQPSIDEILQKLSEGGDFDALMEEYGEDDGMKASPAKEEGYLVCEGDTAWVAEFTQAAMALEKIGDVSPAVRTSFGIHLLQYAGDVQEGEVPLEDVKDDLQAEILSTKQEEAFNATLNQWVTEAGAKIYADRMK
ncbi:MAG: peptidylprolyl isomerase [Candidatus Limiplasma sp.]|nr:peptidylprolyl isomerase [Candidatus Limiplasma sp.]